MRTRSGDVAHQAHEVADMIVQGVYPPLARRFDIEAEVGDGRELADVGRALEVRARQCPYRVAVPAGGARSLGGIEHHVVG